jgi:hypothetical protein
MYGKNEISKISEDSPSLGSTDLVQHHLILKPDI